MGLQKLINKQAKAVRMKLNSQQQLRIDILSKYIAGNLHYLDAMELLKIQERQFRRQVKSFRERGIESVRHGNIGRTPPNKISLDLRNKLLGFARQG